MPNITKSVRKREIGASRVGLKGREIFDEINSYLPLLQKIGATEELLDNTSRAVMRLDEGDIYSHLSEIVINRVRDNTITKLLSKDEKERLNKLTDFLRKFIKDPDYVCSIENLVKLVNRLEEEDNWSDSLEELEEQYYAERQERYEELEYDGYSTD